jgi:hypothetical protein
MSRAQLTSTVEQNSAGAAAPIVAGKNAVINGGLDVWQRGTSFSVTTGGNATGSYTADRWHYSNQNAVNATVSQQTALTANQTYGIQFGRNSGQATTGLHRLTYAMETIDAKRFAGKTAIVSFNALRGANAPTSMNVYLYFSTASNQSPSTIWSGWTGATFFSQANTIATSVGSYSFSSLVPSNANQIAIIFEYTSTGTAGAAEWFQIEAVQLEQGPVATSFSRAGGTFQGELALCQRYLPSISGVYTPINGFASGTTTGTVFYNFPVTARVSPTGIQVNALSNYQVLNGAGTPATPASITFDSFTAGINSSGVLFSFSSGSPSVTAGQAMWLRIVGNASILFTGCEL